MKLRTIYILLGVLGLMLAILAYAMWPGAAPVDTSLYVLPSAHDSKHPFEVADVDRVEIKRVRPKEETLVFTKDPDTARWQIAEPRKLRGGPAVADLVNAVLNATRDQQADLPSSAAAAGLEPPAEVITLKKGEERSVQLDVGNASSESSAAVIYVSTPERPKEVLPVSRSKLALVLKQLNDFRDPYVLAASPADYESVILKLERKDAPKGPLVLSKKEEGLWEYKNPAPESYDGSAEQGDAGVRLEAGKEKQAGVAGLLKVLSDIKVTSGDKESDFVADDVKEADLANYNLDPTKSDVLSIDVKRIDSTGKDDAAEAKSSVTARFGIGKKVDEKATNPMYYAATKSDNGYTVVKVPAAGPDAVALLFKDPTFLCNHNLAALGGFKKPVAVDVVNSSGTLQFRRESGDKPWRMYRDGADVPVDTAEVDKFVNQLVQNDQVRSFLDPKTDLKKVGLDPAGATVSLWVDGVEQEKTEEKKPDDKDAKEPEKKPKLVLAKDKANSPAVRLSFGGPEDKQVVVRREAFHKDWSESALVKTPDLLLDMAKAGPLAYRDKKLPKFNEGFDLPDKGVLKLVLDRNGEHYVISRADVKPETPWKFEEPADLKDHKADASRVQEILSTLDGLRAKSLVDEAPKKEDLDAKYGLEKPVLKAVVTKDDQKTYTYDFGKDAPDGGQYARQSQAPMVFEVTPFDLEPLKGELQDRTIFAFDPAKVKTLKMAGWQHSSGGELRTRELARKEDKSWEVKTPANLVMDLDKVNRFVGDLCHLQAERFVTRNAQIKAEYDKDATKTVLTMEMTVEGEKDPAVPVILKVVDLTGDMTLPEADRGVYATTPQLPGELFRVPAPIFKTPPGAKPGEPGPMDKVEFFSKA